MLNKITITQPDDWHLHLRDGALLKETVGASARCFNRVIVMPNLSPPVVNKKMALAYRQRILNAAPANKLFTPLMTLYLTNQTSVEDISEAHGEQIPAAKLYPAGATTNSAQAVSQIEQLYPVFERMSEVGMILLIHGEVTDSHVDIFDREQLFIDRYLTKIQQKFADLKIVFEHITTSEAVQFVRSTGDNIAATITPQHLLLNRNDLLVGGIRPHNYCLPVLKRSTHQQSLLDAVASGSPKFFLGTDSAPHEQHRKESSCGCAGCYSAWGAIELYTQVFDQLAALDKLEGFASLHGADFYDLPRNTNKITLRREEWTLPQLIKLDNGSDIVPFFAGETINWRLVAD